MRNITMTIHNSPLIYKGQTNSIGLSGSAIISNKSNTKVSDIKGSNPPKFYPSSQGYSNYANLRRIYKSDGGGGENYFTSSQVMELKKINAVGKTSFGNNINGYSNANIDKSFTNSTLRRVRSAGTVAPAKKYSIDNKFQSGGSSTINTSRSLNRVVRV